MTSLEVEILHIINCYKKENPISVYRLTKYLNGKRKNSPTECNVRQAVRSLIMEHGELIGSTNKKPSGYYLITNPAEIEENYQSLKKRALKILARGAMLKKVGLPMLLGQLSLELKAEGEQQGVLWCKP